MTPRPQFDAADLEAELQELGATLRTEVTAFLIGGGAMAFRGLKDTTKDIDLVVTTETEFNQLLGALDAHGYEEVSELDETYRQLGARLCVENQDGCRMDELEVRLVLSEEEPMSVEAIAEERGLDRSHVEEQLRNDSSAMISW